MSSEFYEAPAKQFKWNWGALFLNIFFGFANKAYLTFFCLVPILNFVWIFICGAKGEQWVWETGEFEDGYAFRKTMDSWNRAGKLVGIIWLVTMVISIVALIFGVIAASTAFGIINSTTVIG